jgi:rubrerythrin
MSEINLSRRQMLRLSGTTMAGSLLLAACSKQANVEESSNIASAGTVPPTTALPAAEVNDVVLLRTAASLEYNAIDTYEYALAAGLLTGDYAKYADVMRRFRDDHRAHANAVNGLIVALGGKAHECANTRINEVYIGPAVELITADDNPDSARDTVALAHALENVAAQTYQSVVGLLSSATLRADAMRIGQDEARHAVVLAQVLNPGHGAVGPTVNPDTGRPNIAAVPTAFGSLANISLTIGKPSDEGTKTNLILETPSLNSLVYDYIACR